MANGRLLTIDIIEERCCEIYITRNRCMIFNCSLCNAWLNSFMSYIRHILKEHYVEQEDTVMKSITQSTQTKTDLAAEAILHDASSLPSPSQEAVLKTDWEWPSGQEDCSFMMSKKGQNSVTIVQDENTNISIEISNECVPQVPNINNLIDIHTASDSPQQSLDTNVEDTKRCSKIISLLTYPCDKCERVYQRYRDFQIHYRSHENADRKYKCEQCGFAFKDNGNLRHHNRRYHSQERRYKCAMCTKEFYDRSEHASHMRCHTGERPYVCPTCGKTFRTLSSLTKHNKTHTGFKPYECKLCGKCYSEISRLKEHLASHSGDRNFVCSVCGAKFIRAKTLRTHMKLHANKREYVCSLCKIGFNQRPALLSHMKTKHKIISNT